MLLFSDRFHWPMYFLYIFTVFIFFQGIWQWIKNTVNKDWSEGAQNFKKQIKNATDSVLTTLDPGMEEYLSKLSLFTKIYIALLQMFNWFLNFYIVYTKYCWLLVTSANDLCFV